MKIGLCLAYKGVNYGMLLQAFATQQAVEKLGYETEVIDYQRVDFKHIRFSPWFPLCILSQRKRNQELKRRTQGLDEIHMKNMEERKEISKAFVNKKFKNIVKCNGIIALEQHTRENYNGVLVGSDQVWQPNSAFGNFITLRFAPDDMNKISYAPSFGVSDYPFWCKGSAKQFLKRINHLSVREEQGKKIIQDLCDIPVEVVCDPTYLFNAQEWEALIPKVPVNKEKYILCYFLGATKEHKLLAREYADKHGFKLVTILSTESNTDIDVSYADEVITGAGPEEFVNLIRGAEYVLTDSFHGLAFSVINNKQFYIFYRTKVGSVNSRNSRIDNILNMWGLQSRLVLNDATVQDFDSNEIDYAAVNARVDAERKRSLEFLNVALKECK